MSETLSRLEARPRLHPAHDGSRPPGQAEPAGGHLRGA